MVQPSRGRVSLCAGLNDMSKPEIGTKRQCTNCGAKYFDLRKSPIVCPKCGVVFQAASIQTREVFRRAAKAVPEMEAEESDIQMVPLEEVEEGDDKLAAAARGVVTNSGTSTWWRGKIPWAGCQRVLPR